MRRGRGIMSRDREGAVFLCSGYENSHRLAMLLNYISNGGSNVIAIPQPARTEIPFRFRICFHHSVNVIRPHMRRQKRPLTVRANLLNRIEHRATDGRVQEVRRLVHQVALARGTRLVWINDAMSRNLVVPIHGTGFVAVQMTTLAREGNQVRHVRSFYTARLRQAEPRSRLSRGRSQLGGAYPA